MSSDWYARRLARGRPTPPPQQQPYQPYQQTPPPGYIPQTQAPPTNIGNLWEQMQHWRGGQAHRTDPDPCPHCGSNQYFSRTGGEVRRGPPPAPHCFACGYNGMFEQGLASTWSP